MLDPYATPAIDTLITEDDITSASVPGLMSTSASKRLLPDPPSAGPYSIEERSWSADDRERAEQAGHTLPGTDKFPIETEDDLHSAIHLSGHGDKTANHAYIKRAANRLGLSKLIPDSWT